jgi:hypothetical protein
MSDDTIMSIVGILAVLVMVTIYLYAPTGGSDCEPEEVSNQDLIDMLKAVDKGPIGHSDSQEGAIREKIMREIDRRLTRE